MHGVTDAAVEEAVRTYVKLMRASRSVAGRVEPLVGTEGLTLTQLGVLEVILHKGAMTHRELGRKVLTSAGNMRRVRAANDRRQVRVELTDDGRALIEGLFPRHADDIARAMGGLERQELRQLGELLRKLGIAAARGSAEAGLAGADGEP